MRVIKWILAAFLVTGPAFSEEAGRSGQPLSVYCNTAPELGVGRSDSVENWVRICTLWLGAQGNPALKIPKPKDSSEDGSSPAKSKR